MNVTEVLGVNVNVNENKSSSSCSHHQHHRHRHQHQHHHHDRMELQEEKAIELNDAANSIGCISIMSLRTDNNGENDSTPGLKSIDETTLGSIASGFDDTSSLFYAAGETSSLAQLHRNSEDEISIKKRLDSVSQSMKASVEQLKKERQLAILDPSNQRAKRKKIQEFKSGRMKLCSLKLHGRDDEVEMLQSSLDRICNGGTCSSNSAVDSSISSIGKKSSSHPPSDLPLPLPPSESKQESDRHAYDEFSLSHRTDVSSSNDGPLQRSLILLSGYSGVGKTALARSIVHDVESKYNGLYVSGKYDLYLRDEPYFGILNACREICGAILNLLHHGGANSGSGSSSDENGGYYHDIQETLISKLGADIYALFILIPELEEIVTFDDLQNRNIEKPADDFSGTQQENKAKLHYIFRIFFRCITSYFGVLVIVLDDLQWADVASLDLMEAIMTDRENPKLMMIGLYRSNEVDETHILTKKISNLKESNRTDTTLDLQEHEIGNLTFDAVKSVTMDLLSLEDTEDVHELSSLFYDRTQGNVFFLLSFISMLEDEQLLDYDLNRYKYTWDLEKLKVETSASANVVDMMKKKMSKLPEGFDTLLSIAACLGASFELEKLETVWKKMQQNRTTPQNQLQYQHQHQDAESVFDMVSVAIDEGLIETQGRRNKYRWIHDKVQEAAFKLIPSQESSKFQVRVGTILCEKMTHEELDSSLFLIMNLLNESTVDLIHDEKEAVQLSRLNLRAAEKATTCSAFSSVKNYTKKGIEFLPKNSWKTHYRLTLELYSYAAEAAVFLGDDDGIQHYCNVILDRKDVPICDQARANMVKVSHMSGVQRHSDAIPFLLDILSKLGITFPKNDVMMTLVTIRDLIKVKSIVKRYSCEKASRISVMKDTKLIQVMEYLDRLSTNAYLSGNPMVPAVILRSAIMADRYGLCDITPVAFVKTALILTAVGDFQLADGLVEYALRLLKRLTKNPEARTKMVAGIYVLSWTRPYHTVINLLLEAYHSGMSTGDIENAMYAISAYVTFQYVSGKRLAILLDDCKIYSSQASEHKREVVCDFIAINGQAALNLMGYSSNTTRMEGSMIPNLDTFLEKMKDNLIGLGSLWTTSMRLCLIFGEYEEGADLFIAHAYEWRKQNPSHFLFMETAYCGGVCCLKMAQMNRKKRKYKRYADRAYANIKGWYKKGNPNIQHYKSLFDAERAIYQGKHATAEKYFQKAISKSTRGGFPHDAALGNELYMRFLWTLKDDRQGARFHLSKSLELYREWGAHKKVELLEEETQELIEMS